MIQRKGKDLGKMESVNIGHTEQRRELAQLYIYMCDRGGELGWKDRGAINS